MGRLFFLALVLCPVAFGGQIVTRHNYGQRLEPVGKIISGAGQDEDGFRNYWNTMHTHAQPGVAMYYTDLKDASSNWTNGGHPWYGNIKNELQSYSKTVVLQVGLAMTTDGTPSAHYEQDVAAGVYDTKIEQFIDGLLLLNRPAYVRIGYEFNGSWNGYVASSYKAAFQRITARLRARAPEVATVWTYSPDGSTGAYMNYYPGDAYVDWWGIDIFSTGAFSDGNTVQFMADANTHGKPVMIGESTPRYIGTTGGQSSWNQWFEPFFDWIHSNAGVKMFCYINWNWAEYTLSGWGDARLEANATVASLFNGEMDSSQYYHAPFALSGTPIAPPSAPALVSPIDAGVNVAKPPTFSWDASAGATSYRLQVSASSTFGTTVYDQSGLVSTSQQVTGLADSTTYYWRVNATGSGGTSGWSTIRSFTTAPAAPPTVPTLASPTNGATGVATNPTLTWNSVSGATSYRVQVSTSATFGTTVVDQTNITTTSYALSALTASTTYYWHVSATNSGGTSAYSSAWNFATAAPAPPPSPPVLATPANSATGVATNSTLTWNASTGATSYRLQVSTNSTFGTTVVDQANITTTSYALSALTASTTYYWHVSATNSGGTSAYSSAWNFATAAPPPPPSPPVLATPANSATGVAINPALTWNSVSGATSYRVQVSTSATFATTVVDQANITTTSYAPSALTTSTTYYWHVSAANSAGTSAYSSAWNFTTAAVSGGLVAAYAFDEGTGTTITDLSGLGLSGTISGAAWTTQGKYNNALSFNGTSSYVDLGNPAQLQITGSMTWSAWVRAAANPPDDGQIIAKSDNTTGWQLKSSHDTGPQTFGVAVSASSSSHTQRYSTTVRSLNTWYHVAGVYNATARTLDIYVNGVLDNGTLVGTVPASQYVPSFNVNVGQRSGGYYFNGIIDELRVYSRALTQAEIQTDMNTPLGTPPSQPAPPVLASPANGATNQPTTVTLSWNTSAGATSYRLQASTDQAFGTTVFDDSTITGTSRQVGPLSNSTTYYWRVRAKSSGGTSAYSTVRNFTTIAAPPVVPTLASPANGATNQPATLTLSWNASTGATSYRLQASTDQTFGTTVFDDSTITGTSRQVGPLSGSTTYYWRVRAKNSGGTSAYSTIRNFTTIAAPPVVPTLASPANGATNQPTTVTLSWNTSAGATSYRLQASTDQAFGTTVFDDSTITGTSRQVGLLSNSTTYYWRVRAKNSGGTSAYSSVWNFSTTVAPPAVPTLATPANGATNQPATLTLSWNASAGATSYRLQASSDQAFGTTVFDDSTITGTSRQVGPLSGSTTYYWRVRAKNGGGTSAYSTVRNFTTIAAPPVVPTLASPANGATNQPTTVTLSWNTSAGATSYRLQASTDQAFGTTVFDDSTITGTSRQVGPLSNSTTYYWRVRAKSSGGTSAYSTVRNFTTIAAPPVVPTLATPANGATNQPATLTLSWNASTGATSYRLQASTDQAFGTTVFDDSTITGTSRQVGPLSGSTTYYWRVRAKNSGGTSAYSTVWNFATTAAAPAPPTLIAPVVGKTGEATTLTLLWSASAGATTYRVQLSVDPAFGSTVVDDSTITGTSRQVGPLAENTTYYWRVRAKSSGGTSAYSSVWSFTTGAAVPAAPTLASPPNGAADQSTTLTLSWNASPGAASYHVQVSTSTSFATPLLNQNGITGTSYNASGLTDNTTYYWRVSANNTAGSSPWSAPAWSFVTGSGVALSVPSLIAPARGSTRQPTTLIFMWNTTAGATQYHLRVSSDSQFVTTVFNDSTVSTNWRWVGPLANKTKYYWNVRARSGALSSAFSPTWNLTTIARLPSQARLRFPQKGASNVPTSVTLSWDTSADATTYRLQLATDASFISLVLDDSTLSDTSSRVDGLAPRTAYYWRVQGQNEAGVSAWSDPTGDFTTAPSTFVDENGSPYDFALYQNYPNPFNPTTKITFSVPVASDVRLSVLNLIGQEVAQLVNEHLGAGTYRIEFSGEGLSNGVYFYRMKAGNFTTMRRMILLK